MTEAVSDEPATLHSFSTPEGHAWVRKILQPLVPYEPHDYQITGVCKSLDKVDLLAVLATGGGKTGFLSMYMLVTLALSKNPNLCMPPRKDIPQDPAMVVVCPTNGLEEDMAGKLQTLGLRTLVINQDTVQIAKQQRQNLWTLAQSRYSIIIMSPEMFTRREFTELLKRPAFADRVVALGIDEVHLMNSWGKGFRPCFTQLGFIRARMAKRTTLIALTATLGAGPPTQNVCKFLGLEEGQFYFLKRSNLRPDLRMVFRTMTCGLGGWSFPDFRHVVQGNRKTLIFCTTIAQSFRLAVYLISVAPPTPDPIKRIRMYNALNWRDYNTQTRDAFQQNPELQVVIATDSLTVGVDLENVADVIIAGEADTVDAMIQKVGRAGRNRRIVKDARGIVYVTKQSFGTAHALVDGKKPTGRKKGDKEGLMDMDMARMLAADCKTVEQDRYYNNPKDDLPCHCAGCTLDPLPTLDSCNCSGCEPEDQSPAPVTKKRKVNAMPRKLQLTRAMRTLATERFRQLRWTFYTTTNTTESAILPPSVFLPEAAIKTILDHFALLNEITDLDPLIERHLFLVPYRDRLWLTIEALARRFEQMREEKKRGVMAASEEGQEESGSEQSDAEEALSTNIEVNHELAAGPHAPATASLATSSLSPSLIHPQFPPSHTPTRTPMVPVNPENLTMAIPAHNSAPAGDSAQVVQQYPGCFVSSFRLNASGSSRATIPRNKRPATQLMPGATGKRARYNSDEKENINGTGL